MIATLEVAALPPTRRRTPARSLLGAEELVRVRTRSTLKGVGMIAHCWGVIAAAMALFAWAPNPLTFLIALPVIGSRQLGLAILMHEGAHGGLAKSERLNLWLSQWLCAYPVFAETLAYRRYHFSHHAHTQTREDPDLVLSAPFPISRTSLRRKMLRDLSGQTGFKQRRSQIRAALGDPTWPLAKRARHFCRKLGRATLVNLALLTVVTLAGRWWLYPLLWILPLITWQQLVTRIRNIAEHAVLPVEGDPLRQARTTLANPLERLLFAPYWVNYHAEHHILFYVPCYNLPKLHRLLRAHEHGSRMAVEPGYGAVLRLAASRGEGLGVRG